MCVLLLLCFFRWDEVGDWREMNGELMNGEMMNG